jgi:acylphosphatase
MAGRERLQRREVHYRGRVQGVGFRYKTCRVAARFEVAGYVKNLPDGGVLVLVEGLPEELDRFLAEVYTQMRGKIDGVEQAVSPGTGEFREFSVEF